MAKKITAWSYSRYSDYDMCPLKAKFKHVDKLKEPENEAMKRGSIVHEEYAKYFLTGEVPKSGVGWYYFSQLCRQLRQLRPLVEQQWGFTSDWRPSDWFSSSTWFRSVLDAAVVYDDHTADVVDLKTGKPREGHAQQAELYAVSIFKRYPQVQRVIVRFWYLDPGTESVYRFARRDETPLTEKWEKKTLPMLSDTIFAPRPGRHCNWCAFSKSQGGPCSYG